MAPPFLILTLDGDEWSALRPCFFTPQKRAPSTHLIGGLVEPRVDLEAVKDRTILTLPAIEPMPSSTSLLS